LVPDHQDVAIYANNIGNILQATRDLDGALQYTQRALRIGEKVYGPDHPVVALRANNIGVILNENGDLIGALPHLKRAVPIFQNTYGPDHPQTKLAENNFRNLQAKIALDKSRTPPTE